jgi:hypothetical protein
MRMLEYNHPGSGRTESFRKQTVREADESNSIRSEIKQILANN